MGRTIEDPCLLSLSLGLVSQLGARWRMIPGWYVSTSLRIQLSPSAVDGIVVGTLWRTTCTTSNSCWRPEADGILVRMAVSSCRLDLRMVSAVVALTAMSSTCCLGVYLTSAINGLGRTSLRAFLMWKVDVSSGMGVSYMVLS